MEVGAIKRFADPGHFASYCRTVEAKGLPQNNIYRFALCLWSSDRGMIE
jgi:hypothetical protein